MQRQCASEPGHAAGRLRARCRSSAPQSGDPATALGLKNKKIQFKKLPKKHQKSIQNQSKMDQKSIKNRPKSSIQNTPADAQPRIYKILLPTPSQAPLPTPSQGYTKSSCRRPERETMRKYGIMGVSPWACVDKHARAMAGGFSPDP